MKTLRVDFVARHPVGVWPWIALILALAGFAVYQGWLGWQQEMRLHALRHERSNLAQRVELAEEKRRRAADSREVKPLYLSDAAAVAKLAMFPLDEVLASLESAQVQGVKVTGLEATAVESAVRIDVEFTDHAALLAYLEAINAGEPTRRWVLVQAHLSSVAAAANSATLASSWPAVDR